MKINNFSNVSASEKKYRAKMVKGKHGWLVKGMVFGTLLLGGMTFNTTSADADVWIPNTVEQISNRITEGQTSLTMIEGDTVYNIGLAINIKDPMQLLYDNGFKNGDQYTLAVGTVISWDGNHVTVTDSNGNVIGDTLVNDSQKHNPDETIAGQATDTPKNVSTNKKEDATYTPTDNKTTPSTNSPSGKDSVVKPETPTTPVENEKPTSPVVPESPVTPETPVVPETPETPVKPETPEVPNEPNNPDTGEKPTTPVVPEQPDNRTELEKLKAQLAELEAKLQVAQEELNQASQELANAKATDLDAEIEALQAIVDQKNERISVIQNEIYELEAERASAYSELDTATTVLNNTLATQQQAQEAVNAAQAALDAIQASDDLEQIANAEAALQTAKDASASVDAEVAQAQNVVNEKQNALTAIENQLTAKQAELDENNVEADLATLAELQEQKANQKSVDELEQIVAEKQKVVDELNEQIADVKRKIADIELKVDRSDAINSLKDLPYLTQELVDGYVSQINSTLSKDEIQAIVNEANAKNAELKAQADAEQSAKELAQAKTNAIASLDALTLSSVEKTDFISQVENAQSVDAINAILGNAQTVSNQNKANQTLKQAKEDAIASLDAFTLTDEEKADFVSQINSASSVDAVNQIVTSAKTQSDANEQKDNDAKALETAKTNAKVLIGKMNLTSQQKTTFTAQITASTTIEQIDAIVKEAQAISDKNDADEQDAKELATAKTNALAKLEAMNLKDQKSDFTNQINNTQSVSVIERILEEAQKTSDKNDQDNMASQELAKAKEEALTKLNSLNLKSDQKSDFTNQINDASSIDQVNSILVEAQNVSKSNDDADQASKSLETAKTEALTKLDTLNLKDNKSEFTNKVNAAKSIDAVNAIIAEAQTISDTNDQKDAEDQNQKELATAKTEALAKLDTLNLKDQKSEFVNKVNTAKTIVEIDQIVKDAQTVSTTNDQADKTAKELADAQQSAIAEVKSLEYLSDQEKADFTTQINTAKTIDAVTKVVSDAKAKNEANAPQPEKTLDEVKKEAIKEIQKANLGLNAVGYITKVNKATSIEEVNQVMFEFRIAIEANTNKNNPSASTIERNAEEAQKFQDEFLKELNAYRVANGLYEITFDPTLNAAAQIRAKELEASFEHTRPSGGKPLSAVVEASGGLSNNIYGTVGEAISYGSGWQNLSGESAARAVINGWQNSPDHDSILKTSDNKSFTIGIGFYIGSDGKTYMTFLFGSLKAVPNN
ncbi:hypothetical protein BAU15_11805 [Enterococcus sp. JM4C]|uniref:CAP domain-containing protein n=1 Tax=Candidatus Enterococcus huntleyi TaxID=1857217 RepID=UPI00235125A7|nr:CAP domain-containing protein [Enterococcus sp. JM4C]KAF1298436.1 hypothetical protein BAU15_11805 [Enterococcus sp. JM4C]